MNTTKTMSTKTKTIIAVIVLLIAVIGIIAWQIIIRLDNDYKNVTIVIQYEDGTDKVYNYVTSLAILGDLLNERTQLKAEITSGFVNKIGDLNPNANEFIGMYISIIDYADETWGTATYKGIIYGSAIVGVDSLPLIDGAIIIFRIERF